MIKCFAKEFYRDNISVNGVAPNVVKTKFSRITWKGREDECAKA